MISYYFGFRGRHVRCVCLSSCCPFVLRARERDTRREVQQGFSGIIRVKG